MRVGVARITVLVLFLAIARGDGTDWISPRYLASQAALTPSTAAARKSYISQTTKLSRGGPWSKYPHLIWALFLTMRHQLSSIQISLPLQKTRMTI
jgi:hypothetical protein